VGTLVHRLIERFGLEPDAPLDRASASQHATTGGDRWPWVNHALDAYHAITARSDIRAIYLAGERMHEVPFTMRVEEGIVRGTIDCVVRTAPNRMTLLEFKTGRPRPEHQAQLDLYRRAAEQIFPDALVDARLVYAGEAAP
jgi:ATP-dependent exoDNAse (exonuclease V) beta subunit